jgi:hypothetical protein
MKPPSYYISKLSSVTSQWGEALILSSNAIVSGFFLVPTVLCRAAQLYKAFNRPEFSSFVLPVQFSQHCATFHSGCRVLYCEASSQFHYSRRCTVCRVVALCWMGRLHRTERTVRSERSTKHDTSDEGSVQLRIPKRGRAGDRDVDPASGQQCCSRAPALVCGTQPTALPALFLRPCPTVHPLRTLPLPHGRRPVQGHCRNLSASTVSALYTISSSLQYDLPQSRAPSSVPSIGTLYVYNFPSSPPGQDYTYLHCGADHVLSAAQMAHRTTEPACALLLSCPGHVIAP